MRSLLLTLSISSFLTVLFVSGASAQTCGPTDYVCQQKAIMQRMKDEPRNIENYYDMGIVFQKSGACAEAIEAFTMYITVGVSNPQHMSDGYNNRGVCYKRLKKYTDAIADYSKALEFTPKAVNILVNRGNAYVAAGDGGKGIADFSKAIASDPKYVQAYIGRGHIYFATGAYENALADFNKATEVDPNEPEAYYNRGTLYMQVQKNCAKALPELDKYISLGTVSAAALADGYMNRGICNLETGKFDMAVEDMTRVITFDPKWANAYKVRALAYRELKKVELANADEKKAAELSK